MEVTENPKCHPLLNRFQIGNGGRTSGCCTDEEANVRVKAVKYIVVNKLHKRLREDNRPWPTHRLRGLNSSQVSECVMLPTSLRPVSGSLQGNPLSWVLTHRTHWHTSPRAIKQSIIHCNQVDQQSSTHCCIMSLTTTTRPSSTTECLLLCQSNARIHSSSEYFKCHS